MDTIKMNKPTVKLSGTDGNAFAIMGRVMSALKKAGYSKEDINKYQTEATSRSYDHLMQVSMAWVNVQ